LTTGETTLCCGYLESSGKGITAHQLVQEEGGIDKGETVTRICECHEGKKNGDMRVFAGSNDEEGINVRRGADLNRRLQTQREEGEEKGKTRTLTGRKN